MTENEIAKVVVDVAYQIHSRLGSGLLESAYHAIMLHELRKKNMQVQSEVPLPIHWDGVHLEVGFRADLLIEKKVVVELKSVAEILSVHTKQVLTYARLSNCRLGLLINFNNALIKNGIKRVSNGMPDD